MKTKLRTLTSKLKPSVRSKLRAPAKIADAELLTVDHKAWRIAVCRRAGWHCEWIENGQRCSKSAPDHRMIADHIVERADGGALHDIANGQCLCVKHNTLKGVQARAARR